MQNKQILQNESKLDYFHHFVDTRNYFRNHISGVLLPEEAAVRCVRYERTVAGTAEIGHGIIPIIR